MKGSTLRRSNLTREKMAMMQSLVNYSKVHQDTDFYREQSKERELDVLWQNFKIAHKPADRSPQVYFVLGLITGALITLVMTTMISILINFTSPKEVKVKSYVVESGDTLESIIIRFYGAFDLSKVELIREANNMSNPNALSIGQKLVIPMIR